MNMTPIPIPPEALASRPDCRPLRIGPPPGISDEDCGTVESLVGVHDGLLMYADYWRPTPEQLDALQRGGFIELIQYAPQMVMHSMAGQHAGAGVDRTRFIAVCATGACRWRSAYQVVKVAAQDEARYHREQHRREAAAAS